jgi:ABC-type multidrug transport system ATPase subunit
MPQSFSLYPDLSIEENLLFYGGIYDVTGEEFKKQQEYLYEFSNLKPFAKRRAEALSGGMKQKLALSCALIHNPELLVLDEPTTGVDPLSRRQFWDMLLMLRDQGATIVVATPYMDEVAKANRASFVFGGKVLASGTPSELTHLFKGTVYAAEAAVSPDQLDTINKIPGISARRFGRRIHIYLQPGHSISEYTAQLQSAGFPVSQLHTVSADLEDCFIQLMETPHA